MKKNRRITPLTLLFCFSLSLSLLLLGTAQANNNPFQKIILDHEGNAYVTDINRSRIVKIDALTQQQQIIAGNNVAGFEGDGGLATEACLYVPASLAFDVYGNLYIADAGNSRIRKVDAASGIISTVAGNGQFGFNGDHQYALDTQLNMPYDLLIDGQNNLYIADSNNHRIRKFNLDSGIITTVAGNGNAGFSGDGGLATKASLNWPDGIALDEMGNLYISDALNHRIRKVSAATGLIQSLDQDQSKQASRETESTFQLHSEEESHAIQASIHTLNVSGDETFFTHTNAQFSLAKKKQTFYASNSLNSRSLKLGVTGDDASPSGKLQINHGSNITNSRSVILTLACRDDSSGCAEVRISSDEQHWSAWQPHNDNLLWQLHDQDGEQTLYVQFKDRAGNPSTSTQANIILDRIPPANPFLVQPADGWLSGKGKTRIEGFAEPHSTIEISLDNRPLALVSSAVDGHWSLDTILEDKEQHHITVVVIDMAGNLSSEPMQLASKQ
ncbi:MAG: hypothetical protein Q9N68_08810 [Gammaproteobacteria bacterium]|nr:hypothetical protein [Gammaproteobacteria bacterium]